MAACEEYDRLNEELQAASSLGNSMVSLKSSVLAYPRVDSATEEVVASCASGLVTAEISSYDAENGLLSFDAKAGNEMCIRDRMEGAAEDSRFPKEMAQGASAYAGIRQAAEGDLYRAFCKDIKLPLFGGNSDRTRTADCKKYGGQRLHRFTV